MKNLISIFSFVLLFGIIPMSAQKSEVVKSPEKIQVKAYYFHATRRCETCQAVEKVASEVIKESYSDQVSMLVYNREKEENKSLVKKYKISGQTLLIVKAKKVVNLTNDAFLNARNNPEKFREKLRATIDSML